MAALVVALVLLLTMAGHSDGQVTSYCVCKSNVGEKILQTNIDYACGTGADCSSIHENGACYNPDTVMDHCNYAVNSYYHRKGQVNGSCDFQGTATLTQTPPPNAVSGCVYQSSPSNGGSTTTPGTIVSPNSSGLGLGPTGGTGFGTDSSASSVAILSQNSIFMMLILMCLILPYIF